ncbi:PREDICTED: uncharacterized protein LOC105596826 isoform X4 [Cercocebus atys]|uniref:uncharacterized protein LOC105596826 isoform X4 n=1 Tax=Cercocebus atys TaxID=9531 RepID=UPI0005F3714E|nr:PREDICTED: uncharacterized protein LOC105596826 isoform X4 [Cercocebus atys]
MGEEWGRPAGCGASAGGLDDWLQLAGRHVRGGLPSPLLPPPPPFVQRRALRGALVAPARCAPCHRPAVPVSPLGGQGFVRDAVDGYWAERGTHGSIKMWGGWGEQGRVPVWTPLAPGSQGVEGNVSTALQSQQAFARPLGGQATCTVAHEEYSHTSYPAGERRQHKKFCCH